MGEDDPGVWPLSSALEAEGFEELGGGRLVESFARHFMTAVDLWQERGFDEMAKNYLARLAPEKGARRAIADNGDLIVRWMASAQEERRPLADALATVSWLDPTTGGPRK
jgi:hypothetical protein